MKKKNLLFVAAAMVMAGCASDDMIGDNNATQSDNQVIGFNMNVPATTRADKQGESAATALGNEFIVWGEKNEPNNGDACKSTDLVFENYRVQYQANSANTTTSNTKDWEYVGITPYNQNGNGATTGSGTAITASVYPSINGNATTNLKTQTIKYWELNKNYTFTAVSAAKQDIMDGKVKITKTQTSQASSNKSAKDKGYTIVLQNGADASKIYVAERLDNVKRAAAPTTGNAMEAVSLKFRNFQTKVRFGFYETVPGYNVQITNIAYNSTDYEATKKFGVDGKFITSPTEDGESVTYTVTYDSNNIPVVEVTESTNKTSTSKGYCDEFGTNIFQTGTNYLGTTSNAPTYDKDASGSYTCILPNTGNQTPMTFTVSYNLISEDTKEVIKVENRQVTVPAAYCQWKPNFAYTYLFKISDKSTELYPITFDAVVADDEVNLQKTITEVAGETTNKVCITTLGIGTDGKFSGDVDEYAAGSTIYASVTEGSADQTLSSTNAKLYIVTATKTTTGDGNTSTTIPVPEVITEAAVANCLNRTADSGSNPETWTVTDLNGVTMTVTASTLGSIVDAVPAEDGGTARNITALSWEAAANTYYVVEYIKTDATATPSTRKYYKVVKVGQ